MSEELLTGYPSIDKPWLKYYRQSPIREINAEQTIYQMLFNANKDNMSSVALEYMNVNWSFQKLKEETDKAADAFQKAGLNMGDVVLVGIASCPQVLVILLALNKIGVVSKWFDIRANEKDIQEYANNSRCKFIIAFDMLLSRIEKIIDETSVEKVLIVYPTDTLSKAIQVAYSIKAKKLPKDSRYIRFNKFVEEGSVNSTVKCVQFDKNRPSIMIQSSGTTGKPKVIVHSDYSATVYTKKVAYTDLPIGLGKVALVVLPPWIAYALGGSIIAPLTLGTKIILSPTIDPDSIIHFLGKFTIALTAPVCYRYLKDNMDKLTKKQIAGLSKAECFVSGGDKVTIEENAEFEKIFKLSFINGYGNNESWGCLSVNPTKDNHYGTVGIPKYDETIIAFDNITGKELPYGEIGEICALTETMFLYYENNTKETDEVKKIHEDGKVWIHTGDLGTIDKDGFITLQGRLRRVIIRKSFKISAYTIEDKLCKHQDVKECVAVEVKDIEDEHVPMAYIVLKDKNKDKKTVEMSIQEFCKKELKEYEIPKYFIFVDELPYTPNGKYDFRKLEAQGNEYVDSIKHEDI